jgi:hypothetical protein
LAALALHNWSDASLARGLVAWQEIWSSPLPSSENWLTLIRHLLGWPLVGLAVVWIAFWFVSGLQSGFRPFAGRFRRPALHWPAASLADGAVWSRWLLNTSYTLAMVLAVAVWVRYRGDETWFEAAQPSLRGLRVMTHLVSQALGILAAVTGLFSLAEYGLAYWQLWHRLAMSDDEWREEIRAIEGDPRIEARQRESHRRLLHPNRRGDQ